jgi:hypothetical protein
MIGLGTKWLGYRRQAEEFKKCQEYLQTKHLSLGGVVATAPWQHASMSEPCASLLTPGGGGQGRRSRSTESKQRAIPWYGVLCLCAVSNAGLLLAQDISQPLFRSSIFMDLGWVVVSCLKPCIDERTRTTAQLSSWR